MTDAAESHVAAAPEDVDEENAALLAFIARVRGRNEVPAFVRNVQNINVVALDPKARVQLLNDAIVGDVALTLKVLKIANSAIYAAAGRTVQTVHQAILLLGFERMKDIAVSASVFDHLQQQSTDLRELMACSLLTANQALELSGRAGFPRAEVAYLCGIFRNVGEVVCACYAPEDYARYKTLPQPDEEAGIVAQRTVFRFLFDELGRAIAAEWGLPDTITETIERPTASAARLADGPRALATITQLAADVTDAVYRTDPAAQRTRLRQTVERYGRSLAVDEAGVLEAARDALEESEAALKSAAAGTSAKAFLDRLEYLHEQVVPSERKEGAEPRPAPSGPLIGDGATSSPVAPAKGTPRPGLQPRGTPHRGTPLREAPDRAGPARQGGAWVYGAEPRHPPPAVAAPAAQFAEAVRTEHAMSMEEATARALAALQGMGYQRAALLLAADGNTRLRVRTSAGEGHEYMRDGIVLTLVPPNGALSLSLSRGEDAIADVRAISKYRADPTIKRLRSASFAALPVIIGGHAIGALFADHMRDAPEREPGFHDAVRGIRDALQQAFARGRDVPVRPTGTGVPVTDGQTGPSRAGAA